MIHAAGIDVVLAIDLLRVEEVVRLFGVLAGLIGGGVKVGDFEANGIQAAGGDDVVRERLARETPVGSGDRGVGIVDLIAGPEAEKRGEVAAALCVGGNGAGEGEVAFDQQVLKTERPKRAVTAFVGLGDGDRAGHRRAPAAVQPGGDLPVAILLGEVVAGVVQEAVGEPGNGADVGIIEEDCAMRTVGAGLHADVGCGADRSSAGGIVAGGIDFEFLDQILRRREGRVAVGHDGRAVDGGLTPIGAGAVDDVAGGAGIVHGITRAASAGGQDPGAEARQIERIAPDDGQFLHAALVHDEADAGRRGIEQRRLASDLNRLGHVAQAEREIERDAVAHAELNAFADGFFETGSFDGDGVDAGDEIGDFEAAAVIGLRSDRGVRSGIGGADSGAGDERAGGVGGAADDGCAGFLGVGQRRGKYEREKQDA